MKLLWLILFLHEFVSHGDATPDTISLYKSYTELLKQYGPIISVHFQNIRNGLSCVAQSSLPVTYNVTVIDNTSENGTVFVQGRVAMFGGKGPGNAIVTCEVTAKFFGKEFRMFTYAVWPFLPEIVYSGYRLRGESEGLYEGMRLLYYSGSRICLNETSTIAHWPQLICYSLGYLNPKIEFNFKHSRYIRYGLTCDSDAMTLDDCSITQVPYRYNRRRYNYDYFPSVNCTQQIAVDCGEKNKPFSPRLSPKSSLDPQLQILPEHRIEENDQVTVQCSTRFLSEYNQIIQLDRIQSNGQRTKLITSVQQLNIEQVNNFVIQMNFSYSYIATRDLIKDTFLCTVRDLVSYSTQTVRQTVTYKIAFSRINIRLYRWGNSSSTPQILDVTDEEVGQKHLADWANCSVDSVSPTPRYEWIYLSENGEWERSQSQTLNLSRVDKRVPVTCRVQQDLRSASFNGSANVSFYEDEKIFVQSLITVCDGSETISCSDDYDLVLTSFIAGYVNSCEQDMSDCSFIQGLQYYRTDLCSKTKTCEISTSMVGKTLFSALMKGLLPQKCLSGKKGFFQVEYLCLKKKSIIEQ